MHVYGFSTNVFEVLLFRIWNNGKQTARLKTSARFCQVVQSDRSSLVSYENLLSVKYENIKQASRFIYNDDDSVWETLLEKNREIQIRPCVDLR